MTLICGCLLAPATDTAPEVFVPCAEHYFYPEQFQPRPDAEHALASQEGR